jgi:hypothetical protein
MTRVGLSPAEVRRHRSVDVQYSPGMRLSELLREGVQAGVFAASAQRREPARFTLLVSSLFQGIATMHSSGRIDRDQAEQLVDDAIDLLRQQRGR